MYLYTLFKAVLVEKNNRVTIGFGGIGTTSSELGYDTPEDAALRWDHGVQLLQDYLGGVTPLFTEAITFFEGIMNSPSLEGKTIEFTGASLGGTIAQYLALKYEHEAWCFNACQLGAGLQWDLGSEKLAKADEYIHHLGVEADRFSDNRYFHFFDWILSSLGIRTPGNFGHRFTIPTAYDNFFDTHIYFLGSIMTTLEYGNRNKPHEIPHLQAHLLAGT